MVYAYYNCSSGYSYARCIVLFVSVDYLSRARVEQELILLQFNKMLYIPLQECN